MIFDRFVFLCRIDQWLCNDSAAESKEQLVFSKNRLRNFELSWMFPAIAKGGGGDWGAGAKRAICSTASTPKKISFWISHPLTLGLSVFMPAFN